MSRESHPFRTNTALGLPQASALGALTPVPRLVYQFQQMRDVLSGMGIPAVLVDEQLRIVAFTATATQVFQLFDSDIGKAVRDIPRHFKCERFEAVLECARQTGASPDAQVHVSSGRWFLFRTHPLAPAPGPFPLALRFVDITELKEAEVERDQLAAIVQSSSDAIVGKTLEGVVTSWNPAAETMFGFTVEEMIGKSMMPMIPPEYQAGLPAAYEAIKQGEKTVRFDAELSRKDGSRFPVAITLSPMRDGAGQVIGVSAIIRDITAQKQFEERLAEQSRELARSNAELEQFAGVISHDLRSPLLSITGPLQLIEEELGEFASPDVRQNLKFARESVTRMGDLIKGLLDYSRMAPHKPGPCNVEAALSKAVANLRATITKAHAVVTSDPLPVVVADEKLLVQVIQNLIENGLKYQESTRRPEIHILCDEEESEWVFGVRDNGIGIDSKHFQKIFQMFQRLHGDEARYAGLGLGLATAKKIIERHGGRMWVQSAPGQGSTFFFSIPKPPHRR